MVAVLITALRFNHSPHIKQRPWYQHPKLWLKFSYVAPALSWRLSYRFLTHTRVMVKSFWCVPLECRHGAEPCKILVHSFIFPFALLCVGIVYSCMNNAIKVPLRKTLFFVHDMYNAIHTLSSHVFGELRHG